MGKDTKINWADHTWNFLYGCREVSPGCDNCYARTFINRFKGTPGHHFEQGFHTIREAEHRLNFPRSIKEPSKIFVNSLSDLFHKDVDVNLICKAFDVMEEVDRHTYMILTKRPERMAKFIEARYGHGKVPKHIMLGTSIENQDFAYRAGILRGIYAESRFLSCEPLLGPITDLNLGHDLHENKIGLVIVGGESGPKARPLKQEWVQDLKKVVEDQKSHFFFKQWGEYFPAGQRKFLPEDMQEATRKTICHLIDGSNFYRVGKSFPGNHLFNGLEYLY